jgi:hypothetical protein
VSGTVFFKTKYITQPTMTPADTIIKALNDLTQALKKKQCKRIRTNQDTQKTQRHSQQHTGDNPNTN